MQHQAMPGRRNGPCKFRRNAARKEALYLAPWHHIHEIILEEAFGITTGPSTWPDILFFKRFKTFLPNIVIANVKSGVEVCSQLLLLSWIFIWCHLANLSWHINVKIIANYWNWHWCSLEECHHEDYLLGNLCAMARFIIRFENLPVQRRWIWNELIIITI